MLQTFRDARLVLNVHVDVAGPHAANLRLYEATGVGSLLLTDWKDDLHEMFRVGEEVVAYRSIDECVDWVRRLLADDAMREQIAAAGQARTLKDHTFARRVAVMCDLFEDLLRRAGRGRGDV
jgi:spore maturation protein CgeB